jgi:iturin family lipopeptide synthetase C
MEKLNPTHIANILALTPMQEGMLYHYLKDRESGEYFEQLSLEISGEIHHYYPLALIQSGSVWKQNLSDHIFVFENAPDIQTLRNITDRNNEINTDTGFKISHGQAFLQNNYDFSITLFYMQKLSISLSYNANVFDKKFVEKIAGHFLRLIDLVLNNERIDIEEMDVLSEEEKSMLLESIRDNNKKPFVKTIEKSKESREDLDANFNF